MIFLMVLLTVVVFAIVDFTLRMTLKKMHDARARRERQQALDIGLRLEFADEATSLKRVEVASPPDEREASDLFQRLTPQT